MSLINEALKRTRDASYQPAAAALPVAPSYQTQGTVESRGSKGGLLATMVVALIAVAAILAVGLRVATGIQRLKDGFGPSASMTVENPSQTKHTPRTTPMPATPVKTEVPAPEATPVSPATTQSPSAPTTNAKAAEDELVGRVMEKIKAEQAVTPPEPPKLALQGITFAADGNEAMINGVSLREGEDIEGARVSAIEHRAVRLDFHGSEIVLRLP